MRLAIIGAAALSLAACSDGEGGNDSLAASAPVTAAEASRALTPADLPRIRSGEWEVRTTADSGTVEVTRQCVDADETATVPIGSGDCPAEIHESGGVYTIEARCAADGYVSHTRMTMHGDFQQRYASEMDFVVSAGDQEVSRYKQRMEARFVGPCS